MRMHTALLVVLLGFSRADADQAAIQRGKDALLGKSFVPALWSKSAYESVWKQWGLDAKPSDLHRAVMERYGLHPSPFPNNGLPMGLREARLLTLRGVAIDCLTCHGGSIGGTSYVGLGNTSLDLQSLFEDLTKSAYGRYRGAHRLTNVRGTNEAAAISVYLLGFREPDLSIRAWRNLGIDDELCEDVPAWWLLKKKRTMYHTGYTDARSVRSLMQFMMVPTNGRATFEAEESTFRDIQAYLLSLEAPKYPHPIDSERAGRGAAVFKAHCSSCHGSYGAKWSYPNKIIPLAEIGTDPTRAYGIKQAFGELYNRSWFAQEDPGWFLAEYHATDRHGYQAPPLDGIWATAPYLHNGSVPTLYHLLNSQSRPKVFTRSFRTDWESYDTKLVGWKTTVIDDQAPPPASPIEARRIYDTRKRGRGNDGHTFGDDLTDEQRWDLIEYLKTL